MRLIDLDKVVSIYDEDNDSVLIFASIKKAEVKAIPISWIEKYLKPYKEHFNKLSDKSKEISGAGWVIDVLESMLREWGKENEINR